MKKFLAITLVFGMLAWASSAMAVPIKYISAPMVGATYDNLSKDFVISGASNVKVNYDDGTSTDYYSNFTLNTNGLSSVLSNQGRTIDYMTDSSIGKNGGHINLQEIHPNFTYTPLLLGYLESLQMTVVDPSLGIFEGSGVFSVFGGTLASEFGNNGGLATIGISFQVPLGFNSPFSAMANTKLYPEPVATPEPTTILLLGSGLLGLVGYSRKRFSKKS